LFLLQSYDKMVSVTLSRAEILQKILKNRYFCGKLLDAKMGGKNAETAQ